MLLAFDLDDTLIPTTREFSVGSTHAPFPYRLLFKEPLRNGAVELLRDLQLKHHLAIYTTSLRSPGYIRWWFASLGIKPALIINATIHSEAVRNTGYSSYSKAPALFGIDVIIDDSPGVLMECENQGCHCILLSQNDNDWVNTVHEQLKP